MSNFTTNQAKAPTPTAESVTDEPVQGDTLTNTNNFSIVDWRLATL